MVLLLNVMNTPRPGRLRFVQTLNTMPEEIAEGLKVPRDVLRSYCDTNRAS